MNILLIFTISHLHFLSALHWNSSGFFIHQENIISLKSSRAARINVCKGEPVVVLNDIANHKQNIQIYCFVAGFYNDSDISFSFCEEKNCFIQLNKNLNSQDIKLRRFSISAEGDFGNKKGVKLTISLSSEIVDKSGKFYCKAIDAKNKFRIESDHIEIRDLMYWRENLVENQNNDKIAPATSTLPIVLPCSPHLTFNTKKPEWIDQEFSSPVIWKVCPLKLNNKDQITKDRITFSTCVQYATTQWRSDFDKRLEPRKIKDVKDWTFTINKRGELIIFHSNYQKSELSYGIMCYTKKQNHVRPITTYIQSYEEDIIIKGVKFDKDVETKTFSPTSPKIQNMIIYARKTTKEIYKIPETSIYVMYSASSNAKTYWLHNNNKLEEDSYRRVDKYQVYFKSDITLEMEGNYTLVVKERGQIHSLTVMVSVLGSPTLKESNCLPPYAYVWENTNISFSCSYKYKTEEMNIQINSLKLNFNDSNANIRLKKAYPHLTDLNFQIYSLSKPNSFSTMVYRADLLKKSLGQTQYQDHSVTFTAKNNLGSNIKSTSIYILPRVKTQIEVYPDSFQCSKYGSSTENYEFACRFKKDEYLKKSLLVDHYWTINNHKINNQDNYTDLTGILFSVSPTNDVLKISPKIQNQSMSDVKGLRKVKNLVVICHIEMWIPASPVGVPFYDSLQDKEIKVKMEVKLNLDPVKSSIMIVSLILFLIIMVVIITIIIIYHKRQKGETYLLDKIEADIGYDRKKELEDETFKLYQPGDHESEDNQSPNSIGIISNETFEDETFSPIQPGDHQSEDNPSPTSIKVFSNDGSLDPDSPIRTE